MANDYYTKSGNPSTSASLASSAIRAEFALIEAAFDLMPDLTSVASRVVHANAGSTALTTTSGFTMASGVLTVPSGITLSAGTLTVTGGTVTTGATTSLSLATTGGTQAQVVNVASAVEYVGLHGAASTGMPYVQAVGAGTNLSIGISSKGTGGIRFFTNATAAEQVRMIHVATADRYIELGGGNAAAPTLKASSDRLRLPEGVYVGADSTNNLLDDASTGAGTATLYIGNASINVTSDVRLKSDIEDTKRDALAIVNALRVVDHTWNDPSDTAERNRNSRGSWMGLIAQESVAHVPWIVNAPDPACPQCLAGKKCAVHVRRWKDLNADGEYEERSAPMYWHMDLEFMGPVLVRAIQQLSARQNAIEGRL